MSDRIPGFSTLAIHAGAQPDPSPRETQSNVKWKSKWLLKKYLGKVLFFFI